MVSHRSLSDSKSSQVSRTLLSILTVLNNTVFCMKSIRPLISKSSSPFINPLVTVPSVPITIGITVTFMFHSFFFSPLVRSWYLSLFSLSFSFTLRSAGTAKFTFLLLSSGLVVWPRLGDPFVSQNHREVCALHFPRRIQGCAHTIFSNG